jgi:hypothetical protein
MPILHSLIKAAAKPIPAVISPRAHSIIDYITVGVFLAGAVRFWRRNKRAAIAAGVCGGAKLAVSLMTAYPGGVRRSIRFGHRREIDLGLAAMTATMPEFLGFEDEPQKKFFQIQGALSTAVAELTDFPDRPARSKEYLRAA